MKELILKNSNRIQAFVYFGAMILLIFVGLRLAGKITETQTLIGIGIEAFFIFTLAVLIFVSPNDKKEDSAEIKSGAELSEGIIESIKQPLNILNENISKLNEKLDNIYSLVDDSSEQKLRVLIKSELHNIINTGLSSMNKSLDQH